MEGILSFLHAKWMCFTPKVNKWTSKMSVMGGITFLAILMCITPTVNKWTCECYGWFYLSSS